MPGGLSTPPASPGKQLTASEPETAAETETTDVLLEAAPARNDDQKSPSKLTISTSTMHPGFNALTCATLLSPDASAGNAADPGTNNLEFSTVLTPELLAVGELVAAMKRVVGVLGSTFDSLGEQTERVASLAPALKAAEQVRIRQLAYLFKTTR